jgi:hypothetical protein
LVASSGTPVRVALCQAGDVVDMSRRHPVRSGAGAVLLVLLISGALLWFAYGDGDGDGSGDGAASADKAPAGVSASLVQLRRDEALRRVEVNLLNEGSEPVHVSRLSLSMPGFAAVSAVDKDSPVAPGISVNLPITYGKAQCDASSKPPGRVVATVRMSVGQEPARRVRLTLRDPDKVHARVLSGECLAQRLAAEVSLAFNDTWRRGTADAAGGPVLHGTLEARLKDTGAVREITQLAGNVIYGLHATRVDTPLARLDAAHPTASIPVVVSLARCDGHARGEIKQPYAFLAWLREPGGKELPMSPQVGARTRTELRYVCPF